MSPGRRVQWRARAEARNIMGHVFGRAALMTRFREALDAALSPQTLLCRLRLRGRFRRIVKPGTCLHSRGLGSPFLSIFSLYLTARDPRE